MSSSHSPKSPGSLLACIEDVPLQNETFCGDVFDTTAADDIVDDIAIADTTATGLTNDTLEEVKRLERLAKKHEAAGRRRSSSDEEGPMENETFGAEDFFAACGNIMDGAANDDSTDEQPTTVHHHDNKQTRDNRYPSPPPSPPTARTSTIAIPLRQWMHNESGDQSSVHQNRQITIKKTTIAYAIAELLHYYHSKVHGSDTTVSTEDEESCNIDNFIVRVSNTSNTLDAADATIEGVDMITPELISLQIISPSFLSDDFFDNNGLSSSNGVSSSKTSEERAVIGQYLEVEIQPVTLVELESPTDNGSNGGSNQKKSDVCDENLLCHLFGVMLYELYSECKPFGASNHEGENGEEKVEAVESLTDDFNHSFSNMEEPRRKKKTFASLSMVDDRSNRSGDALGVALSESSVVNVAFANAVLVTSDGDSNTGKYVPLKDMGFPASLSMLVNNLLECGLDEFASNDAVPSLKAASNDLHLLLKDPRRYLFDPIYSQGQQGGGGTLNFMQNKMYGRDDERSRITDIFCRVSLTGESECLLIEVSSPSTFCRGLCLITCCSLVYSFITPGL